MEHVQGLTEELDDSKEFSKAVVLGDKLQKTTDKFTWNSLF